MDKKTLILTCGDPAGIGPEIIEKALSSYDGACHFIILGDKTHFSEKFIAECDAILPLSSHLPKINFKRVFYHLDFETNITAGQPSSDYAKKMLQILNIGTLLCLEDPQNTALVTAPIQKDVIASHMPNFHGHTDYIRDICNSYYDKDFTAVMMLTSPELKAVPLTVHIPYKDVPHYLNYNIFKKTIAVLTQDLQEKYDIANPHIAISGLNPHAGDNGLLGLEEEELIKPIIKRLARDYNISGPYAADGMFHKKARQSYDVALCMYHDQALIPIKTLAFDEGVNTTLGLPMIRTSPDHGTALAIAGQNQADPSAMLAAIFEAERLLPYGNIANASAEYKQTHIQKTDIFPI